MAGKQGVMQSLVAVTADSTINLTDSTYSNATGAHGSATFYARVPAIGAGDTWTLGLYWHSPVSSATRVLVAASGDITAAGVVELALQAPFATANHAIPAPLLLIATNTIDGGAKTITFATYSVYGD